jgi:hypothetical protein
MRSILISVLAVVGGFFLVASGLLYLGGRSVPPSAVSSNPSVAAPSAAASSGSALKFPEGPFRHSGVITSKEDRFKGYTVVGLDSMRIAGTDFDGLDFRSHFITGSKFNTQDVTFNLTSTTKNWTYIDCKHASFLVDGLPFYPGQLKWSGHVGRGYVMEFFTWYVPIAEFLQMVTARSVEVKICNDEYKLSPDNLVALRDLASRIPH